MDTQILRSHNTEGHERVISPEGDLIEALSPCASPRIFLFPPERAARPRPRPRPCSAPAQIRNMHEDDLSTRRIKYIASTCLSGVSHSSRIHPTKIPAPYLTDYYQLQARIIRTIVAGQGLNFTADGKDLDDRASAIIPNLATTHTEGVFEIILHPDLDLAILPERLHAISIVFYNSFGAVALNPKEALVNPNQAAINPLPCDSNARLEIVRMLAYATFRSLVQQKIYTNAEAALAAVAFDHITKSDTNGHHANLAQLTTEIAEIFHLRLFGLLPLLYPTLYKHVPNLSFDITEEQIKYMMGYDPDDLLLTLVNSRTIGRSRNRKEIDALKLQSTNNIRTAFLYLKVRSVLDWLFQGVDYPLEYDNETFAALESIGFKHLKTTEPQNNDLIVYLEENPPEEHPDEGLQTRATVAEVPSSYEAVHWGVYKSSGFVMSMWNPFPPLQHKIDGLPRNLRGKAVAFFRYMPRIFEIKIIKEAQRVVETFPKDRTLLTDYNLRLLCSNLKIIIEEAKTYFLTTNVDPKIGIEYYVDLLERIPSELEKCRRTHTSPMDVSCFLGRMVSGELFNDYFLTGRLTKRVVIKSAAGGVRKSAAGGVRNSERDPIPLSSFLPHADRMLKPFGEGTSIFNPRI